MKLKPAYPSQQPGRFNCLPVPILQKAVNEAQNNTQAPVGLVLFGALAAAAMATQGLADVELPSGAVVPLSLMLMALAKSGERKSTIEGIFLKAIRLFEEAQQKEYTRRLAEWEESLQIWNVRRSALEKAVQRKTLKGEPVGEDEEALRHHLRSKPVRPARFKMLYEDATAPALFLGLHRDFPYAGLFSSEGATILNGSAFNDLSKQNTIWSGDPVTIDRASAPSFRLAGVRLTNSLMVQPSAVEAYQQVAGDRVRGSGLWARFLVCNPGTTQGTRFVANGTSSWEHCERFGVQIRALLERNLPALGALERTREILRFSPEASARWLDYYNYVESQVAPGGCYFHAGDHASKLPENVGRVAAVLHCFEGFEGEISLATLEAAIQICDAASADFLSIFVPPPQEQQDAWLLTEYLGRLRAQGLQTIPKNHVRQYGPNVLRNKDRLDCAIAMLCAQRLISLFQVKKTILINLYPPPMY